MVMLQRVYLCALLSVCERVILKCAPMEIALNQSLFLSGIHIEKKFFGCRLYDLNLLRPLLEGEQALGMESII